MWGVPVAPGGLVPPPLTRKLSASFLVYEIPPSSPPTSPPTLDAVEEHTLLSLSLSRVMTQYKGPALAVARKYLTKLPYSKPENSFEFEHRSITPITINLSVVLVV